MKNQDNDIAKCKLCNNYTDKYNEYCNGCWKQENNDCEEGLAGDDFMDNNVNIDYYDYTKHPSYKEEK